jgi:restriction system protein
MALLATRWHIRQPIDFISYLAADVVGGQQMTVPDFQSLMLPIIKIASDGQEHNNNELWDALAIEFELTDDDLKERLSSGQSTFKNRVAWARVHLKMGGLMENTGRGTFRITDRGQKVLKSNPQRIDVRFLMQFPDYYYNKKGQRRESLEETKNGSETETQTPEEKLESIYQAIRHKLADELLEQIKNSSPGFFEELVVNLLVAMGYGGSLYDAGKAIGRSGDGGIDGIIKEDKLGLDAIYIQAKRWEATVGRPVVQGFVGSLEGVRARKGVLITTSQFSPDAREYVNRIGMKIVLIDGHELADLMIDHGVGVSPHATYIVKKIDLDYFGGE